MSIRVLVSILGIAVALAVPGRAAAETELVVIGPVAATSKVSVAAVQKILDKNEVAPRNAKLIDAACAIDATCLAAAGTKITARRVLAVSVGRTTAQGVPLDLVLVDVRGSDLLSRRQLTIPEARLAKDLVPALKKFVTEAPVERAKALFAKGNEHYNLGEFVQALEQYRRAYRAKPLPAFLFNIAQCHRKLGQHADAVTMYQSYLAGVPDAQNKALVESLIAESRVTLAAEQKSAAAAEQARRDAERIASENQKAQAMRRAKEAELEAAAARAKAEGEMIKADRELYNRHPARKWAYIGVGVGAVALIGGGVLGMQARDAQARFDDAGCGDPSRLLDQAVLATCKEDRDLGKSRAALTNIVLGGGGALLVTAALVFVLDPGNLERPALARAQIAITPASVNVTVRW